MPRLRRLAIRAASVSLLGLELPLLALWVALASVLSVPSAAVRDWNAMTDELVYERLAISVGQTHSPLPHLHGEVIRSLAQLYPLLISPWFAWGHVPADLTRAHVFDAWLMSSACIPAFLLARRVTGSRPLAYLVALVTVCTPWIVYSTTLLTEVAGYPAFLWAVLAMHHAAASPSARGDALALVGLLVAFFARTQFVLLVPVLPLALLAYHLARARGAGAAARGRAGLAGAVRAHRVITGAYVALGAAALAIVASGHRLASLSVYGAQNTSIVRTGWAGSITGHVADLAFGVGILPLLVGSAWLLANAVRPPASPALHAFACVGATVAVVLVVLVASWDLGIGTFVLDRYLYYLVPVLVLGFLCALADARRPRWSLALPVALVAFGFARHLQGEFLWSGQFPLSTDSPIATLYKPFADLGGGTGGASAILVAVTLALAAAFVAADRLVRPALLALCLAVALAVAAPADTAYTFVKLFSRDGHAVRPLTRSEAGILDWVDLRLGTGARVTEVPYPVSTAFLVTQKYWRDLEFWNKSVRYAVHYPTPDVLRDAVIWFPDNPLSFDPRTGRASATLTPYVVQSVGETRFRISGAVVVQTPDAMLIQAAMPWRTDWLTSGLYDDGWTRPRTPARVRVFAAPGARRAVTRTLTLQLRAPPGVERRRFELRWPHGSLRGVANGDDSVSERIGLCVPAHGSAAVALSAAAASVIPGDQQSFDASVRRRRGGLLVSGVSLADEIGPPCRP